MSKKFHLIVGDTQQYLAEYATAKDSSAYLITLDNVNQEHHGTAYTSLGDLSGVKELFHLLSMADQITYRPPDRWSDGQTSKDKFSMAWLSEHYIGIAKNLFGTSVDFLPTSWSIEDPVEPRKVDTKQLWVAGCSTTFGVGVSAEEKYAEILSKKTNLPFSLLARPGSAVSWAADQILRSDVRAGDIVIFGVTTFYRITIFENQTVKHVGLHNYKNFSELTLQQLDSDTRIYETLCAVDQVSNFCNKIGAKLILIGIHANLELSLRLSIYKNFIFCHGKFGTDLRDEWLDLGNDIEHGDPHSGPKTHQMYADLILSKAKELEFI